MKKRIIIPVVILLCAIAISVGAIIALGTENEPQITVEKYSLVLEDSVNLRYFVHFENVADEDVQEKGILVWETAQPNGYTLDTYETAKGKNSDTNIVAAKITTVAGTRDFGKDNGGLCHYYDYTGIAAKQFTDSIYVVGYVVDKDGNEYYSELSKFSVLHYAKAMGYDPDAVLDPNSENYNFASLLQAMMQYGAEAQKFFEYGDGALPTDKYYIIKLAGGAYIKNDLSKIGLYKTGTDVTIVAPLANAEGKGFTKWTAADKDGNAVEVANSESYEVAVNLNKDITYTANYGDTHLALDLKGGAFKESVSLKYPENADAAMTIPKPEKAGYVFSGWYESDVLTVDAEAVTSITKNTTGGKILYARWDIINETFTSGKGLLSDSGDKKNGSAYNVNTDKGILEWYDAPSDSTGKNGDSFVQYATSDTNGPFLWSKLDSAKKFTVSVKLALDGEKAVSPTNVQFGAGTKWSVLFKINASGEVILGDQGSKIAQLTTDFTTIYVTVDFKNMGIMTATVIDSKGEQSTFISLLNWDADYDYPDDFCKEVARFISFRASDAGTGYILMDDVVLYGGDFKHPEASRMDVDTLKDKIANVDFSKPYAGVTYKDDQGNTYVGYVQDGVNRPYEVEKTDISGLTRVENNMQSSSSYSTFAAFINKEAGNTISERVPDADGNYSPRLMLNEGMIENLVKAYNSDVRFRIYLFNMASNTLDGTLPAATYQTGRKGVHNYDGSILYTLEAKALMYIIERYNGNPNADIYGYEAILGIKNYLNTLNIQWINSDRCREYGSVMYVAAEIYDWCYGLLTDTDKDQIMLAVEYLICKVQIPEDSNYVKENSTVAGYLNSMEVGFPPKADAGVVSSHSSEMMILRDYLSAAIAFYDEDPTWYNYIGGKVYGQYVEFREAYFTTKLYPQGPGYANHRFAADLYSAWMLKTLTGKNPFDPNPNGVKPSNMESILLSFASYEQPDGYLFVTGDRFANQKIGASNCFIAGALFGNETLYSIGKESVKSGGTGANSLSVAQYLIFASATLNLNIVDTYAERDVILYNGSYVGQIISRSEWKNENAPAAFMKIGERTTANHEHADAGTFQIYYKGMLSGDSGVYASYGSEHWKYYHQATIAHNGLLVADPNKLTGTYSGGQRRPGETATYEGWENSQYDTGDVTGYEYAYKDTAETKADFAYISGNITAAYESAQASYVGRSMLTIYTDDAKTPMIFVTFDRITAAYANYKSTYLLHAVTDPTIDEANKTVTIDNSGGGRLVFKSLTDAAITKIGGTGKNYSINGVQCGNDVGDDGNWGRVELSATAKDVNFFNVMYVTDTENSGSYEVSKLTASTGIEAAKIGNYVVAFVNSDTKNEDMVTITSGTTGTCEYFLAGFAAGTWEVSVGGETIEVSTTKESGLLHFEAAAGEVTITKKN